MPGTFFYINKKKVAGGGPPPGGDPAILQHKFASANATSVTATLDSTATSGNLLVAFGIHQTGNGTINNPSGWTVQETDEAPDAFRLYTKVSDGTETGLTLTKTNAARDWTLCVVEVENYTTIENTIASVNGTASGSLSSVPAGNFCLWFGWAEFATSFGAWSSGGGTNTVTEVEEHEGPGSLTGLMALLSSEGVNSTYVGFLTADDGSAGAQGVGIEIT